MNKTNILCSYNVFVFYYPLTKYFTDEHNTVWRLNLYCQILAFLLATTYRALLLVAGQYSSFKISHGWTSYYEEKLNINGKHLF